MTSPTALNDIADLLRILEQRPEWAERLRAILLTKELLALPEKVTQLAALIDRLAQAQAETNRALRETNARVDRLAQAQEETNAKLDRFIATQEAINAQVDQRLDRLAQAQEETSRALHETNARLDRLAQAQEETSRALRETNARVDRLTEALQETNARLDRLAQAQEETNAKHDRFIAAQEAINASVDRRLETLENQVSDLLGSDLENRLHGNITSIAARNFNLRRVHILKSRFFPPNQNFYDRLYAAEDAGSITPEQALQLQETDFILSARATDTQQMVYLAVEVSRTVAAHDITRARERADALLASTGAPTIAMVIGNFIPDPEQDRAQKHNVTLIREPMG